jgi:hypothetical protein
VSVAFHCTNDFYRHWLPGSNFFALKGSAEGSITKVTLDRVLLLTAVKHLAHTVFEMISVLAAVNSSVA